MTSEQMREIRNKIVACLYDHDPALSGEEAVFVVMLLSIELWITQNGSRKDFEELHHHLWDHIQKTLAQ